MPANNWMNLTFPAVTVRADARSAPAAIAGYPGRLGALWRKAEGIS